MPHAQIIYVLLFSLNLLQQVVGNQLQVLQFCYTLQGVRLDGRSGADTIAQSVDLNDYFSITGAPDKPCGVGRADANPKLLLNDT